MVDPDIYELIRHPYITEKSMDMLEKPNNKLEFVVKRNATKDQIKRVFEKHFKVEVVKINTRHTKHGKRAIIKLAPGYSAEQIGTRMGVF